MRWTLSTAPKPRREQTHQVVDTVLGVACSMLMIAHRAISYTAIPQFMVGLEQTRFLNIDMDMLILRECGTHP